MGGPKGNGTVFKVDPAGNYTNLVVWFTYLGPDGGVPEGGLIIDAAGNLYGTTYSGGNFSSGVVFKVATSGTYTALYNFAGPGADGANPRSTLAIDAAGNLYGTTLNGGTAGKGIVFKLDTLGKETVLHSFTGTSADGASPEGALAIDQAGNLYGTTLYGGTAGKGVVFKLDSAGNETVLHSFAGTNGDGASPDGGVIRDGAGNLYGTTLHGGTTGNGIVFKVDSTGLETVVHSFTGTNGDGSQPQTSLTLDAAGNLYGTTWLGGASGGGTIFKVDPAGNETVLFSFAGPNGDGLNPQSELVMDSTGNLYGITPRGGATIGNCNSCGTIFKVDPTTGNETVFYRFTETDGDGGVPRSGLTQDSAGNLYGTAEYGGSGGSTLGSQFGTVFKLDPAGNETTLYSFTRANGDGSNPVGGVIRDSAGNLYGTTAVGGNPNDETGTVFKLDPSGTETVLFSFGFSGDPEATLVQDTMGNLYGTTYDNGGSPGFVFKVTPTGTETVLHTFGGPPDGGGTKAAMILDSAGNLYGTTRYGGNTTGNCLYSGGCGTVFKVDPQGNETVLYTFLCANGDGCNPQGPVIRDSAGNLYGTTAGGGTFSNGTVFKLDPTGHETVLYSFTGTNGDGSGPLGGLIMDSAEKLYGTTAGGGSGQAEGTSACVTGCGTVFVLQPGGGTTTSLTSSLNPSAYGEPVTFTATVTWQGSGIPTGTVTFSGNGNTLGTATLNSSGQATFTTNSAAQGNPLTRGTDSILAQYGGDSTFASSTSAPLSQVVLAPLQSITVSPNPATVAIGQTVQFTATGNYSDGTTRDLTTTVTWSSAHRTASISNAPGTQGLATGVEVEKGDTITATQDTISGTAQLRITQH